MSTVVSTRSAVERVTRTSPAPISRMMHTLNIFALLAVSGAFALLFIWGEQTRDLFAWTIDPPAAAAFLGAGYGSIVVSSLLSLRAGTWAEIRIPVAVLLIGLVGILLATLLHLDRFHFWRSEFVPRNVAIGWIVLYGSIPPLFALGLAVQFRTGMHIVPRYDPLPGWARLSYAMIALITGVAGFGLFLAPAAFAPLWFWPLTPLLARMVAAWLIGVFSAAALVVIDNHVERVRIVAVTLLAYVVLQAAVLARYAQVVNWARPMAWLWVFVLALLLLVNLWAWRAGMRHKR